MKPHQYLIAFLVLASLLFAHGCAATSGAKPIDQLAAAGSGIGVAALLASLFTPIVGALSGLGTWLLTKMFQTPVPFAKDAQDTGWSFGTYILIALAAVGAWIVLRHSKRISFDWFARMRDAGYMAKRRKGPA